MNSTDIVNTVNTVVDLVQKFLPLIHKDDSGTIDKVIDTLQTMAPLVVDQVGVTFTGVKNIIASVGNHPATKAEQLAALMAFNKQVDDAWAEIEAKLDPDA
jgi:hypothetical protein